MGPAKEPVGLDESEEEIIRRASDISDRLDVSYLTGLAIAQAEEEGG